MPTRETLKFADALCPLIVRGQKTTTWRLDSDHALAVGQDLGLIHHDTGRLFGVAEICSISERTFGTLTPADFAGHEPFADDREMLGTYEGYYHRPVDYTTPVTVVKFAARIVCNRPGSDETDVIVFRDAS